MLFHLFPILTLWGLLLFVAQNLSVYLLPNTLLLALPAAIGHSLDPRIS